MKFLFLSQAMVARGYRGNPVKHHIYFLTKLSIKPRDWAAIAGLLMLVALSMYTEYTLPAWIVFKHVIDSDPFRYSRRWFQTLRRF